MSFKISKSLIFSNGYYFFRAWLNISTQWKNADCSFDILFIVYYINKSCNIVIIIIIILTLAPPKIFFPSFISGCNPYFSSVWIIRVVVGHLFVFSLFDSFFIRGEVMWWQFLNIYLSLSIFKGPNTIWLQAIDRPYQPHPFWLDSTRLPSLTKPTLIIGAVRV